ncbi:MAG: 2Fe-2S iron-sulfur cluster-binding protein [Coprothermobacterota bacterium]|nr:2Fe-2S iron-sulfur cluster-binding protein [Coprothermobacterota bacterium]
MLPQAVMIQMKIDGKEIEAQEGQTILQVAQQNGIEIPVLCNHEALLPFGGCRMCLVEAGSGALKAACTTPVADKMDVKTRSAEIDKARMTILQLLFGERNHYCMYCESTGNCELQDLGYRLGLDHFEFAPFQRNFPQDTSHPYFLLDHARCVLCGRCVRACSDLAGHMTLGVRNRGTESQVDIDLGVPLKSSTCTSCGLCVQVCPTGALTDKRAAYLGRREKDIEVFSSACDRCPVGCGLDIYKRSNFIVKIWGNWQAEPSKGVLCKKGRYQPLYETRTRLTAPWRKEGDQWKELSTDEALENIAQRLDGAAVVVEGSLGNEALAAWKKLGLPLYAADDVQPPLASTATLADRGRFLNQTASLVRRCPPDPGGWRLQLAGLGGPVRLPLERPGYRLGRSPWIRQGGGGLLPANAGDDRNPEAGISFPAPVPALRDQYLRTAGAGDPTGQAPN